MGVGNDRERERPDAVSLQERNDDPPPGVRPLTRGPGVHQQPVPGGGPDGGRITLPDVEKM